MRSSSSRLKVALGVVALLVGLAVLLWPREPAPAPSSPEPQASAEPAPPASPSAERPALAPPRTASVTVSRALFGVVADDRGDPVAGATVRALPQKGGEALVIRTGPKGEYVLLGVPKSLARLEFSATGFVPQTFDDPHLPPEPRARWDATLVPARGVYGRVVSNGEPVGSAFVALAGPEGSPRRDRRRWGRTRTDGDGRFALDWPDDAPDGVRVFASHPQHGEGEASMAKPGSVEIALPGGGFVEGRVVESAGRPVPSFTVSASALEAGGSGMQAVDDEAGRFRLGPIAPGESSVFVVAAGFRPASSARFEIKSGETISDVEIVLQRSTELRGRVTDLRTGLPIAGATIEPIDWDADTLAESVGATTDAGGRYVLASLPGVRTSIRARAAGYRSLVHGGVNGKSTKPITLDFSLTPEPAGEPARSEITGIGAQLRQTEQGAVITGVLEAGPASKKLQRGDVVVMVEGLETKSADLGDIVQAIRGEIGTKVTLWVLRGGEGAPERVTMERSRVTWRP